MSKPWESTRIVADAVYSEFFAQGDEEKRLGLPLSSHLVDRNKKSEIPSMQHTFFVNVVIPAFEILSYHIPETAIFVEKVKSNQARWKELMDKGIDYKMIDHHG